MQIIQLVHERMARVQGNAAPFSRPASQCLRGDREELVKDGRELSGIDLFSGVGGGEGEEFLGWGEAADAAAGAVEGEDGEWDSHCLS